MKPLYTEPAMADDDEDAEHEGDVSKILCPFCSAPWDDKMVKIWHETSGCESGGYDTSAYLDITCSSCKRLIYRKETYR